MATERVMKGRGAAAKEAALAGCQEVGWEQVALAEEAELAGRQEAAVGKAAPVVDLGGLSGTAAGREEVDVKAAAAEAAEAAAAAGES